MRLYLHIGTEKTGSTAIQAQLERNRDGLAAQGYALPRFLGDANHRALACAFISDEASDDFLSARALHTPRERAEFRRRLLQRLDTDRREAARHAHSYVISSEHFQSRLSTAGEVRRFACSVLPLFSEVRVLCYLRRQDRMALSFYTEKLRNGYLPATILPLQNLERWAPILPPFFDFEALLERWSAACPGALIEPRIYSRGALEGGDVVQDFFAWLGCPAPAAAGALRANAALSRAGQTALLAFNRAHGGDAAGRARSQALRERLNDFLQRRAAGSGRLPARREAEFWLQAFAAANGRVARRWFARGELFDRDLADYPAESTPPDWERAAQLLAEFLAMAAVPQAAPGAAP
mgnify:CR=1 FL=1